MSQQDKLDFQARLAALLPPQPVDAKQAEHKTAMKPQCPKDVVFVSDHYDPSTFPHQTVPHRR